MLSSAFGNWGSLVLSASMNWVDRLHITRSPSFCVFYLDPGTLEVFKPRLKSSPARFSSSAMSPTLETAAEMG